MLPDGSEGGLLVSRIPLSIEVALNSYNRENGDAWSRESSFGVPEVVGLFG